MRAVSSQASLGYIFRRKLAPEDRSRLAGWCFIPGLTLHGASDHTQCMLNERSQPQQTKDSKLQFSSLCLQSTTAHLTESSARRWSREGSETSRQGVADVFDCGLNEHRKSDKTPTKHHLFHSHFFTLCRKVGYLVGLDGLNS